jgi:hypothetical protein
MNVAHCFWTLILSSNNHGSVRNCGR